MTKNAHRQRKCLSRAESLCTGSFINSSIKLVPLAESLYWCSTCLIEFSSNASIGAPSFAAAIDLIREVVRNGLPWSWGYFFPRLTYGRGHCNDCSMQYCRRLNIPDARTAAKRQKCSRSRAPMTLESDPIWVPLPRNKDSKGSEMLLLRPNRAAFQHLGHVVWQEVIQRKWRK